MPFYVLFDLRNIWESDTKYKLLNLDFHVREIYISIRFSVLVKKMFAK